MEPKDISRRKFIRATGLSVTALTLGFYFSGESKASSTIIKGEDAENFGVSLNAWIHIDTNGKVTIVSHRAEMGQGAYQAIPQMVAEELEVNLDEVNIIFGKGDTGGWTNIHTSIALNTTIFGENSLYIAVEATFGFFETY